MYDNKFCEPEEIMEITRPFQGRSKGCGPVVFYKDHKARVIDSEAHIMEIGQTGTGKSYNGTGNYVLSVLKNGESGICVDPKGESAGATLEKFRSAGYDVTCIDFRNPSSSDSFNPLSYPYNLYHSGNEESIELAIKIIADLGMQIYPEHKTGNNIDPFWDNSARESFFAATLIVIDSSPSESEVTLRKVTRQLKMLVELSVPKYGGRRGTDKDEAKENLLSSISPRCRELIIDKISIIMDANDSVARDINSVVIAPIESFIRTKGQKKILEGCDTNIQSIRGDKKFVIFIILPDESEVFNKAAGILLSQLSIHLVDIAGKYPRGMMPIRVNIIVEELGNIGSAFVNLPHLMTAGRSRNIRMCIVLQSLRQLSQVYGPDKAEIIRSNAGVVIIYRTNDLETIRLYSELCGDHEVMTPMGIRVERLIEPSAIASLKTGQALIMIDNNKKFVANLPNYNQLLAL